MSGEDPGSSNSGVLPFDISKLPRGAISIRGVPVGRTSRLPSIRTPRDLTLVGPAKRTFVPNIPARRDKKSLGQTAEQTVVKVEPKSSRSSPSTRGQRGRGRGQREYVQLPGAVFGQGVATAPKAVSRNDCDVKPSKPVIPKVTRSSTSSTVSEVIIKKEPQTDMHPASEGEEFDGDFDYTPDGDDSDYEPPVYLPLKVDPEFKVKQEKGSKAGWNIEFIKHCKRTVEEDVASNLEELLFQDGHEDEPIFFEFPDTILFPLRNRELADDSQRRSAPGCSNSTSTDDQSSTPDEPSWSQSVEGYIGKLQLLKSGKSRLVIGDFVLDDIELLEPSPVLQQLVSVKSNQNALDMTVMGQVRHKVRFMADVSGLGNISIS